jgi:CheY-like chemotaxis protein
LIVEDEVMIRIFMRDVFEGAGFKTREAANADEALELLKSEEFAAILSDIEMPGTMTGVDLAWVVKPAEALARQLSAPPARSYLVVDR